MSHLNLAHAVSGATGGIISTLVSYPLITISSRSQVTPKQRGGSNNEQAGLLKRFRQTITSKGISSLYSGVNSALFGVAVTNFVYFGALQQVKSTYLLSEAGGGAKQFLSVYESMLASAIAGAAAVVVSNPIWVVNTRCMCQTEREEEVDGGAREPKREVIQRSRNKTAWDVAVDIVRYDGISALWHGLLPALVLVINPIIQYVIFEQVRGWAETFVVVFSGEFSTITCTSSAATRRLGPITIFALSAIAKLIATAITYPSLVLKSRRQLGGVPTRPSDGEHLQLPVTAILVRVPVFGEMVEIVAGEGLPALYAGFTAKVVQSMLTAGILFAAKEELLHASLQMIQVMSHYVSMLLPDALCW